MSRLQSVTTPAPFTRVYEKVYDKSKYQKWLERGKDDDESVYYGACLIFNWLILK